MATNTKIEIWTAPRYSQYPYAVIVDENGTPVAASHLNSESMQLKFHADPTTYMARNAATDYELDEVLEIANLPVLRRRQIA